jgi:PilZ domain-containing protein
MDMLTSGSAMFLVIPDGSNKRVLHPGKVIESDAMDFVCEFEEAITPVNGSDATAYAEVRGKFMQQGVSVIEVRRTEPTPVIAFRRVGPVAAAESRQTYRVSVAVGDLVATIGGEAGCRLVDVSPTGFGAVLSRDYQIGSSIFVILTHEGRKVGTTARVQAVKQLPNGKFRCGFLPSETNGTAAKMLSQISASAQRAQLRRLAGVA